MIQSESAGRAVLRRRGVLIVDQGGRGGVSDYTRFLASALVDLDIPVTIATAEDHLYPDMPGVRIEPVFHYTRGHSPLARLVRRNGLGRPANGLRFLCALPRLALLSRRHALTHTHGWETPSIGVIATLLLRASGAVVVYTAHNTFERGPRRLDSARVLPVLTRRTIVHTEADRDRVSRPPAVIPHGHYGGLADDVAPVDPDAARVALGLPHEAPVVLLFGVLRPDKGLVDLLDAVAEAPEWRVVIAGEEHGGLAGAADRLAVPRLAERVTVREGFQPMGDVARLFAAADLVALPYRQASQSGALHLAYGFKRPVVAYPVGGLVEAVIPGVTGLLCRDASPGALASALREAGTLGRSELRRLGEAGGSWARASFDWDHIAASTEAVYLSALLGRPVTASNDGIPAAAAPAPSAATSRVRR
ncbi:MAG TPA: glycosyltransferase family 4 protein [Solirubrobacteraceae bacterium]|nr:glycosyltransferase family 4 protein [Solirubrobacteraceae bacterium]